jgi:hypothetical protein
MKLNKKRNFFLEEPRLKKKTQFSQGEIAR